MLAWMLTPNIFFCADFGKILFSVADIVNGLIIYDQVRSGSAPEAALTSLCVWLFNPITLVVSTRGNAESIITLAVLATLYLHRRSSYFASGTCLGLAVHLKFYPIVYCVVLYTSASSGSVATVFQSLKPDANRVKLVAGFCTSLAALSSIGYYLYGWPFLHETYLYHLTRRDVKHNFSPYFYPLYLYSGQESGPLVSLATFIPQLLVVIILSWRYRTSRDLSRALFLLTFGFVTFNKVVTSQYFLWYLGLLPLCLPELDLNRTKSALMATAWLASQAIWLLCAYRLEFLGHDVMLHVWAASLVFFAVNVWILVEFVLVRRRSSKHKAA